MGGRSVPREKIQGRVLSRETLGRKALGNAAFPASYPLGHRSRCMDGESWILPTDGEEGPT